MYVCIYVCTFSRTPLPYSLIAHDATLPLTRILSSPQIRPRERDVVFSSIKDFKVLHHLPNIYHTTEYGVTNDAAPRYDYYKDVYQKRMDQIKVSAG